MLAQLQPFFSPLPNRQKVALRGVRRLVRVKPSPFVPFLILSHPSACLSHAQWRALGPGEKLERLLGISLNDTGEILLGRLPLSSTRYPLGAEATDARCLHDLLEGGFRRQPWPPRSASATSNAF
jgi:hypothetical protein